MIDQERSCQRISKLFGHGKTHIPLLIRKRLDLKDGDIILWELTSSEIKIYKAKVTRQTVE